MPPAQRRTPKAARPPRAPHPTYGRPYAYPDPGRTQWAERTTRRTRTLTRTLTLILILALTVGPSPTAASAYLLPSAFQRRLVEGSRRRA